MDISTFHSESYTLSTRTSEIKDYRRENKFKSNNNLPVTFIVPTHWFNIKVYLYLVRI